jgi:hypothetical protein
MADNGFAQTIVWKLISGNRSGCRTIIDTITGASTAATNYEWGVGESSSSVSMLCFCRQSVRSATVSQSRVDGDREWHL